MTVSVKDVTEEITGKHRPEARRSRALRRSIDRRIKERTSACEAGGLRCRVASFFEGLSYFEIAQLEILDVRLVYAPAEGIGNFGGETDNWRWPRHTGDWSFYRAYVGPDGKPAPYAKDNVPYKPARFLKVQPAGVKEGDLVFVAGYPGRTQRLETYAEVKEAVEWTFPRTIRTYQEQIDLLEALAKQDPALADQGLGPDPGPQQHAHQPQGHARGPGARGAARAEAGAREASSPPGSPPIPRARRSTATCSRRSPRSRPRSEKTRERDAVLGQLFAALAPHARRGPHRAELRSRRPKKLDVEREPGYQQRDWSRIREAQERAQRSLDPRLDRALLRYWMRHAAALPADQRIAGLDKLVGPRRRAWRRPTATRRSTPSSTGCIAGTKLADKDVRLGLLDKTTAELAATEDSFVDLALLLDPLAEANREAEKR